MMLVVSAGGMKASSSQDKYSARVFGFSFDREYMFPQPFPSKRFHFPFFFHIPVLML